MSDEARAWRTRAEAAVGRGDLVAAEAIYRQAMAALPDNAPLRNSAGALFSRQGRHADALPLFEDALRLNPDLADARINRAIALQALGCTAEAYAALDAPTPTLAGLPRFWSVRGTAARELGRHDDAALAYDRLLGLEPTHARGLHGRARVALERGEADMCARFEQAIAHNRADATAFLGYAQALDYAGRSVEARQTAEMLVERLPAWVDALEFLAALRWAAGERDDFTNHYERAVQTAPTDPAPWLSWCRILAGVDRHGEAAAVAARGSAVNPGSAVLALAAASSTSEAGELDRAEALFARLSLDGPDRWLQEARHRLRQRAPARAEPLLAAVIAQAGDHVGAWALRDLAWRMMEDSRSRWLHGQQGLVAQRPLNLEAETRAAIVSLLSQLHDGSAMPVGQSVRDGSQTRGGLFQRMEPELRQLRDAVVAVIADHRAELPAADPDHPLLRHRDDNWSLKGSWSIRVRGGGHHTEHVHPLGILSSAAHLVLPTDIGRAGAGCLELGRSPPDLGIGLEPIATIMPVPWTCVLFPSTLYHGTRPFTAGERLTVAFDIAAG